jgi:hypothetical protein
MRGKKNKRKAPANAAAAASRSKKAKAKVPPRAESESQKGALSAQDDLREARARRRSRQAKENGAMGGEALAAKAMAEAMRAEREEEQEEGAGSDGGAWEFPAARPVLKPKANSKGGEKKKKKKKVAVGAVPAAAAAAATAAATAAVGKGKSKSKPKKPANAKKTSKFAVPVRGGRMSIVDYELVELAENRLNSLFNCFHTFKRPKLRAARKYSEVDQNFHSAEKRLAADLAAENFESRDGPHESPTAGPEEEDEEEEEEEGSGLENVGKQLNFNFGSDEE